MKTSSRLKYVFGSEVLLLVPLGGTWLSYGFDWEVSDFVVGAILLAGMGFALSLIMEKTGSRKHAVTGLLLLGLLFVIWAELAVGIFGTPLAGS